VPCFARFRRHFGSIAPKTAYVVHIVLGPLPIFSSLIPGSGDLKRLEMGSNQKVQLARGLTLNPFGSHQLIMKERRSRWPGVLAG
jgi:hypothetical protein